MDAAKAALDRLDREELIMVFERVIAKRTPEDEHVIRDALGPTAEEEVPQSKAAAAEPSAPHPDAAEQYRRATRGLEEYHRRATRGLKEYLEDQARRKH